MVDKKKLLLRKSASGRDSASGKNSLDNDFRYQDLLQHLPVGVYRTTSKGRIIEANQALADILGCKRIADLWQVNVNDFYVKKKARRDHMQQLATSLTVFSEFELHTKDGKTIWVRDYPRAVKGPDGRVLYYDGLLVDISERMLFEAALRQSEQDYRQLFENAHDAIVIFTRHDEIILDVNHRTCELYGFSRQEMIGMSLEKISKDVRGGKTRIKKVLKKKIFHNFETVHFRKDGSEMLLEINAALITYKKQPAILSINRDITSRKLMEAAIHRMAYQDSLTGLPNRSLLQDRLVQALKQAKRHRQKVTLLYLDLDGFKAINDTFGHGIGDELLKVVSDRLQNQLRSSDTVARLGGDEFLILLPEAGRVRAGSNIAGKILSEIRRPYLIAGCRMQISTSIGMAIFPHDGRSAKTLIKKADQAMYAAKAKGRDTYCRYFKKKESGR
ncbi:MAG: diguanylate cyclase [Candidatus Aminicenantes bacterium]|nr:diguanylate cyclase [Acidobacteriota bacterium]MCG2811972.1 diguanylate cyclase [Candidatus Aminicenantes bacterium]